MFRSFQDSVNADTKIRVFAALLDIPADGTDGGLRDKFKLVLDTSDYFVDILLSGGCIQSGKSY